MAAPVGSLTFKPRFFTFHQSGPAGHRAAAAVAAAAAAAAAQGGFLYAGLPKAGLLGFKNSLELRSWWRNL